MRYTFKDADECGERLAKVVGKEYGKAGNCFDEHNKKKPGCWLVDYNATYGGAVIREVMDGGGEKTPLGDARMSPANFCRAVSFAVDAIEVLKSNR